MQEKAVDGLFVLLWTFSARPIFELQRKRGNGVDTSPRDPTTKAHAAERRKTARCLISGTVRFEWQAVNSQWHDGIAIIRDIGKGGIFVESDSIPQVGSQLKLTSILPSESKPNISVQLVARVRCAMRDGRNTQQLASERRRFSMWRCRNPQSERAMKVAIVVHRNQR